MQPSSSPPPSWSKLPEEEKRGGVEGEVSPTQPGGRLSSALPRGLPRFSAGFAVSHSLSASFPPPPSSSRIRNILYSHLILFNYSIIKHIIKT